MSDASVRAIAGRFIALEEGAAPRLERLGSGHIHATLRVVVDGGEHDVVLQRINEFVFPDAEAVMANIARVTDHLRRHGAGPRGTLELLRGPGGGHLERDGDGAAWRAFRFVARSRSHDTVRDDALARAAARAFGRFAAALADLDAGELAVPLPGFHDLGARLAQLRDAVREDAVGRAAAVADEVGAVLALGGEIERALQDGGAASLPTRVVHNDCKVNNLLFDAESDEPLCVVDLDTVMPGTLLADFGELVRTAGCDAAEDEQDLSRVVFSPARYRALAEGYREGLAGACSELERALLWLGPPWMAIENAARFLADHLRGDVYFRSGDNRARARTQHHLAAQLWAAREALQEPFAAG